MTQDRTCEAKFQIPAQAPQVLLEIRGQGVVEINHASMTSSCQGICPIPIVEKAEPFIFTAEPAASAMLGRWTGDCTPSATDPKIATMLPVDGASCIATFEPGVVLDVEVVNPPGFSGRVLATQGAALECLDACSVTVAKGTMVTLVGTTSQGDQGGFEIIWGEGCAALSGSEVQLPVDANTLCRATFTLSADPCLTSAPPTPALTVQNQAGQTLSPGTDGSYVIPIQGLLTLNAGGSAVAPGRTVSQYEWVMPDGTNQYQPQAHLQYSVARGGSMQVRLQVRDSCGETSLLDVRFYVP